MKLTFVINMNVKLIMQRYVSHTRIETVPEPLHSSGVIIFTVCVKKLEMSKLARISIHNTKTNTNM